MYYQLICQDSQGAIETKWVNVADVATLATAVEGGGWTILELKLMNRSEYKHFISKEASVHSAIAKQTKAAGISDSSIQAVQSITEGTNSFDAWKYRDPLKPVDPLKSGDTPDFLSMSREDLLEYFEDTPFDVYRQQLSKYTRKSLAEIHARICGCKPVSTKRSQEIIQYLFISTVELHQGDILLGKVQVPNNSVPDFLSMGRGEFVVHLNNIDYRDAYSQLRQYNLNSLRALYSIVFNKEPPLTYGKRSIIWTLWHKSC